uniref:Uncharacterized protein n=1 Tax=Oryza brachyantha TaxID=4533 RepID=J3N532_ORYBR
MRKQQRSSCSSSSAAAAVLSLCKVLLMVLALICTLQSVPVQGGRTLAAEIIGVTPTTPARGCRVPFKCSPPPGASP